MELLHIPPRNGSWRGAMVGTFRFDQGHQKAKLYSSWAHPLWAHEKPATASTCRPASALFTSCPVLPKFRARAKSARASSSSHQWNEESCQSSNAQKTSSEGFATRAARGLVSKLSRVVRAFVAHRPGRRHLRVMIHTGAGILRGRGQVWSLCSSKRREHSGSWETHILDVFLVQLLTWQNAAILWMSASLNSVVSC